jgi:hypothetical protein
MTSAQRVRKVLLEEYRNLTIEDLADGGALVRDASAAHAAPANGRQSGFPVSETLYRCADVLADSGFAVALLRDEDGVYLNAR